MNATTEEESELDELLADLNLAIEDAKKYLYSLSLAQKSTTQKIYSLILCNAIINKAETTALLGKERSFDSIAIISRTTLIHYIDFKNNLEFSDYYELLNYLKEDHWLKSLKSHKEHPDAPFSRVFSTNNGQDDGKFLDKSIEKTTTLRNTIKTKLNKRYKSGDKVNSGEFFKFQLAKMIPLYNGFFRYLSRQAHGNLDALADPLISEKNFIWPPNKPSLSQSEIYLILDILLESITVLHKKYPKQLAHCLTLRKKHYRGLVEYKT